LRIRGTVVGVGANTVVAVLRVMRKTGAIVKASDACIIAGCWFRIGRALEQCANFVFWRSCSPRVIKDTLGSLFLETRKAIVVVDGIETTAPRLTNGVVEKNVASTRKISNACVTALVVARDTVEVINCIETAA